MKKYNFPTRSLLNKFHSQLPGSMNSLGSVGGDVCVGICIHPKEHGYSGSEVLVPHESHEPSTAVMFLQMTFSSRVID